MFEKNKNSEELGIDTSRKFIVIDNGQSSHPYFKEGDILIVDTDNDNDDMPSMKRLSDGKIDICFWNRLAYADESEWDTSDMTQDEPKFKVGDKVRSLSDKTKGEIGTIVKKTDWGSWVVKGFSSGTETKGGHLYCTGLLELAEQEDIIIHCPTKELWDRVEKKMINEGFEWGGMYDSENWSNCQEDSCIIRLKEYNHYMMYDYKEWYKENYPNIPIISAEEYLGDSLGDISGVTVPAGEYNCFKLPSINSAVLKEKDGIRGETYQGSDITATTYHEAFPVSNNSLTNDTKPLTLGGRIPYNIGGDATEGQYAYDNRIFQQYNKPNNKTMLQKLTSALKRFLPTKAQTLYKAGYINGDLEATDEGTHELLEILREEHEDKLVARAEEKIKEEEKKDKKK